MNLLEAITNGQGQPLQQLARQFGIDQNTAENVVKQFLPALTNGVKKNVQRDDNGLDDLLNALNRDQHERYLDQPEQLNQQETVQDGNNILGHLFGDKQVSRELAGRTAKTTGLDSSLLKQMLPMVASMMMGALNKQTQAKGINRAPERRSSSQGSLMDLLDADGDGSPIDDLLGMAQRFFR